MLENKDQEWYTNKNNPDYSFKWHFCSERFSYRSSWNQWDNPFGIFEFLSMPIILIKHCSYQSPYNSSNCDSFFFFFVFAFSFPEMSSMGCKS